MFIKQLIWSIIKPTHNQRFECSTKPWLHNCNWGGWTINEVTNYGGRRNYRGSWGGSSLLIISSLSWSYGFIKWATRWNGRGLRFWSGQMRNYIVSFRLFSPKLYWKLRLQITRMLTQLLHNNDAKDVATKFTKPSSDEGPNLMATMREGCHYHLNNLLATL